MKIKILWAEYEFGYKTKLLDEDGGMCFGTCDNLDQEIRIEWLASPDRRRITVLHENLHALNVLNGLGLSEDQIQGISHQLYTVMKENPKLIPHMVPHIVPHGVQAEVEEK